MEKHYYLFDLNCIVYYSSSDNCIQCYFDGSADLFDEGTLNTMAHRFELALTQLICSPEQNILSMSLLFPHEMSLLKSLSKSTNDCLLKYTNNYNE